jgi:hypothetical protein
MLANQRFAPILEVRLRRQNLVPLVLEFFIKTEFITLS